VAGLPEPHPLHPDADRVLTELRTTSLRYEGRLRALPWSECVRLGPRRLPVTYAPDIRPLGRPATSADVRAGDAVFELNGQGRLADVKLPAWILPKGGAEGKPAPWGRAVQAEVGPDGKVVYGAIFRRAIRPVTADEVERVEPVEGR
jgi:hypothetical protein